jgi:hypothetical protein
MGSLSHFARHLKNALNLYSLRFQAQHPPVNHYHGVNTTRAEKRAVIRPEKTVNLDLVVLWNTKV